MIDHETAERIKATADIVEVVGDYVKLTRRGANYMGLCPFHNERTPSFSVNKARNFCYCFSCHKGGSPVNFIMEKEGIGYQDALRQLARKYGIKIEEHELTEEELRLRSERESLFIAGEWAMQAMQRNLTDTSDGRAIGLQYLYQRGITDEAISKFHLGYSPDRNVLEEAATKEGFNTETLKKIGLLGVSQQGKVYDRFRGRVMFPVFNPAGKVVAFGGRDLKGGPAKYINSPETEIYKKSNELYGLYQARQAIVKADKCFLVEGYMDVIGMWQAGMENVIASSGTALTDAQIALIHRFTSNITLLYDGDQAGIKASLRGIDMLLSHNLDIKVLLLPDGHDPDSFARANSAEEFRQYVNDHEEDFITFKARVLISEGNRDPQSRAKAATSIVESLACISDKVKRSIYIKECSRILQIDEQALSYETDSKRHLIVEKLIENRKRKSELNNLNNEILDSSQNDLASSEKVNSEIKDGEKTYSLQNRELLRIEQNLIRYCLKYGMIFITPNGDDKAATQTIVDYIQSEFSNDEIKWSNHLNKEIFTVMYQLQEQFKEDYNAVDKSFKKEIEKKQLEEIEKIAVSELDITQLDRKEKELLASLDEELQMKRYNYAKSYIEKIMMGHERNDFRNLATQLISERYVLSKYHAKSGNLENEEDKLDVLVPRAINELRAQILEMDIAEIEAKIKQTSDFDAQLKLMQSMQPLLDIRKRLAVSNGERIINPR